MQDNSIVSDMLARAAKAKEQKQLEIENLKDFAKHLNSMFATDSGMLFGKYWLRDMGLFIYDDSRDGVSLVENKGASRFYKRYVRPNLSAEVRKQLEGQE